MTKIFLAMGILMIGVLHGGGNAAGQGLGESSVYMPLEELARTAELIVKGTVRRVQVASGVSAHQRVTVSVKQVIKGRRIRAGGTLALRTDPPAVSTHIPFKTGEDVVLFLQRVPGTATIIYDLTGGIQGKVAVTNGRVVVDSEQITVGEFIRRIRQAL